MEKEKLKELIDELKEVLNPKESTINTRYKRESSVDECATWDSVTNLLIAEALESYVDRLEKDYLFMK